MKLRKSSCTFFAATALALAGCGESDSTTYTNPVPDLLITIGQQERKAAGAKGSVDMSLKDATTKATMLSAVKVKGESSVAEANAQAVLDAKAKVDAALTEATAALTALQEAKTEADALPADTPNLEELKAELATAITEATRHRDAIQALKDATGTGSLAKLVEKVTGANGKGTPADIAAAVAVAVEKAMVFYVGTEADSNQRTYPPITGGITPEDGTTLTFNRSYSNSGDESLSDYDTRSLHNLPGVRLQETDYANYGYWLGIPSGSDTIVQIATFGTPKDAIAMASEALADNASLGNSATYRGKALGISVLTADDENGGRKAVKSGEFTAAVSLTATFGDSPKVKGTINKFEGVKGDNWSIELKEADLINVQVSSLDQFGLARGSAGDSGAEHDGRWYARASNGTAIQRPMGISGSFRVFFPDGRAIGGYATVKDE